MMYRPNIRYIHVTILPTSNEVDKLYSDITSHHYSFTQLPPYRVT